MYAPTKNNYQSGGDNTDTVLSLANTFHVGLSTVSTIVAYTGVTPYSQYNQMSPDTVAKVINVLNNEIATATTKLATLNAKITEVQNEISNVPTGLQYLYDAALMEFKSTSTAYVSVSTSYFVSISTYSSLLSQINGLSSLSSQTVSSLQWYEYQYSTLYSRYITEKTEIDTTVSTNQQIYKNYINQYRQYESTVSTFSGDVIAYRNISTKCIATPDTVARYNDSLFDFTGVNSLTGSNGKFTVLPTGSDGTQAIWSKTAYSLFDFTVPYIASQSYIIMLSPKKGDVPSNKTQLLP